MREEFYYYKYIISFNSKTKSKNYKFHGNKKGVNWHGMKGERDSSSMQQVLNKDFGGYIYIRHEWGSVGYF